MPDRIPPLTESSRGAMDKWFSDMADSRLIFHPEDPASSIVLINNGEPFFSASEAAKAQSIIDGFFALFGSEAVNDAAYPHFMRAAGFALH